MTESSKKQIWVDGDACPVAIKEILYRAANRTKTQTTFVENGFDIADDEIVKRVEAGQLVITSDIPLASEVIDKGATALSPRGELFTKENIRQRLNIRDFMDTMRSSGIESGGPPPLNQTDRQQFANCLDRYLAST